MRNWKETVVSPDTPLRDAIASIDASGIQAAMVVGEDGRLAGLLTDGNVRRAILAGVDLGVPTREVMHSDPFAVSHEKSPREMLAVMRRKAFHHLPLVDGTGLVVGLVTLDELTGLADRSNWVVLMVGGLGTRLRPLTDDLPKPLLPVGGRPILETIVERFTEQGFRRLFLAVNYKAELIRGHFGDGQKWGAEIRYLDEEARMGTAGALSLLPQEPEEPVIVMNGDLLTHVSFDALLEFHESNGAMATMSVREYDFQVPYGVVRVEGTEIQSIEEKPVQRFFVNAGIYVLSPEALGHIPPQTFVDMPTLFHKLRELGHRTVAYPLREYWIDIGRLEEFENAQADWERIAEKSEGSTGG